MKQFSDGDRDSFLSVAFSLFYALGEVGRSALSHYSYMGYTVRPEALLEHSVPDVTCHLRQEQVDAVVLAPV